MSCIITRTSPPPLRKNDFETVTASPFGCWAPPSGFWVTVVSLRGARAASVGTPSSLRPYSEPLAPRRTGPSGAARSTARGWAAFGVTFGAAFAAAAGVSASAGAAAARSAAARAVAVAAVRIRYLPDLLGLLDLLMRGGPPRVGSAVTDPAVDRS